MEPFTQLALIWSGVFVAVLMARATRLTPVVYYLGVGSLMVNLGWLPVTTEPFIRGLSELGIVVIMFALGFEENANAFVRSIRHSWGIAIFGALAPFLVAFGVATYFWESTHVALLCGLAMTATAVSLTMVSLRSEGLQASPAATRIMTSAVLDDIASLALVAIVVPLVTGAQEQFSLATTGVIVGKAFAFFAAVTVLGVFVFPRTPVGWGRRIPLIGRFGVQDVLAFDRGRHAILQVLLLALVSALLGHYFGFHPAVGAYMAGLILNEEYFGVEGESSFEDTRRIIDSAAFTWVGPVFFVSLGGKLVLDWDLVVAVMPHTLALTLGVFVSQILAASLAARFTGGMGPAASVMIGLGMLGRAELAFVVMDIAYVQHSILTTEAFYTLMFTCFWLNIAVPLLIHAWKPRYQRELDAEAGEATPTTQED